MPRSKVFLVGVIDQQITGSKLPSKRQCLSVLFYNMRFVGITLTESASLVIDECLIFWKKARIPTQDKAHCVKKLKKLYETLRNLEKSNKKTSEQCRKKERDFDESLDNLFDIAHAEALNIIKIEEDKQFLLLQREKGRVGCMIGVDKKLSQTEKRKEERERKLSERKRKEVLQTQVSETGRSKCFTNTGFVLST